MPDGQTLLAWGSGLLAAAFGVVTLKSGGSVLFGPPTAREAAGDYVPFLVWFNFSAGFLYLIAGAIMVLRRAEAV